MFGTSGRSGFRHAVATARIDSQTEFFVVYRTLTFEWAAADVARSHPEFWAATFAVLQDRDQTFSFLQKSAASRASDFLFEIRPPIYDLYDPIRDKAYMGMNHLGNFLASSRG
jgi:hypothetical protein